MKGGDLSANFGSKAIGTANVNAAPVMSVLAPNVNLNVQPPAQNAVKADAGNGAALAKEAKASLAACQQDVKRALEGGKAALKERQAEVCAAEKANGMDVGTIAPARPTAPDSAAGLVIGGAAQMATGKGSAGMVASGMLKASDKTSMAADIASGLKAKPLEQQVAAVEDTLKASSPDQWKPADTGIIKDANETPVLANATGVDWEKACDIDPDIVTKCAGFDPDNLAAFPELKALEDLDNLIEAQIGTLTGTEVKSEGLKSAEMARLQNEFGHSSRIAAAGMSEMTGMASMIQAKAFGVDVSGPFGGLRQNSQQVEDMVAQNNEAGLRQMAMASNIGGA